MKHVRALPAEPPLLYAYRQSWPKEEQRPPSEAKATWEGFKTDVPAYDELRAKLVDAQQGLCIYCEQRVVDANGKLVANDYQVEHVQAKSGGPGRVLDWTNLALACAGGTYPHHEDESRKHTTALDTSCGQRKDDADLPPGSDPRGLPLLAALVEVGMDGKLTVAVARCAAAGVSPSDLDTAIGILNLNCERLRMARQSRRDNINEWQVPLLAELLTSAHLDAAERQEMLGLLIAGRLKPDGHGHLRAFWTTERCALGPDAEAWIAKSQGLFS